MKYGIIAGNGRFPVLALESGFWEFLDASGRTVRAHEVEKDGDYTLVMSTASGLLCSSFPCKASAASFSSGDLLSRL